MRPITNANRRMKPVGGRALTNLSKFRLDVGDFLLNIGLRGLLQNRLTRPMNLGNHPKVAILMVTFGLPSKRCSAATQSSSSTLIAAMRGCRSRLRLPIAMEALRQVWNTRGAVAIEASESSASCRRSWARRQPARIARTSGECFGRSTTTRTEAAAPLTRCTSALWKFSA
jgi:hypothetical protein